MTWCFVAKTTPTEVYPVCGTSINTCKVGTLGENGTTGDGTNRYYWGCKGSNTTWKDDMTWCFAPKTSASADGQNYATASIGWESLLKLIQALR